MKPFVVATTIAFLLASPARAELTVQDVINELGLKDDAKPVRERAEWKKPKTVVVVVDSPERLAWMEAAAPGVKLIAAKSDEDAANLVKDADGLIVQGCPAPTIQAAKKARWVHSGVAGVEKCVTLPAIADGHILLTNTQRVNGGLMAEHVLAVMLEMTRGLAVYLRAQDREEYNPRLRKMSELWEINGRTMLIAGLGGIGTEVAKRAHALGMKIIATRASGSGGPDFVSYVGKPDELGKLAGQADVVVSALPLTADTKGVYNAKFFAGMRHDALFINVGRGESVNQPDLIAALNNGTIGGAAIDVMNPEPLPKGDPLWKTRNLIITPHVSGWSDQRSERGWLVVRENLRRYVAGEKMLSVVDPKKGY